MRSDKGKGKFCNDGYYPHRCKSCAKPGGDGKAKRQSSENVLALQILLSSTLDDSTSARERRSTYSISCLRDCHRYQSTAEQFGTRTDSN